MRAGVEAKLMIAGASALVLTAVCVPAAAEDTGGAGGQAAARSISAAGDPERGRKVFYRCQSCHRAAADGPARLGPNLGRLFGRPAGSDEEFDGYSAALKNAGFIWTEERLDAWLKDPAGFLPGNRMAFAGVRRAQDRADLIAYLRQVQDRLEAQEKRRARTVE